MKRLGTTKLEVFPLCLGGSIFGWTVDQEQSFALLDAYVEAGGNFIDTADAYSAWVPGNSGGESERIIGNWMASRGNRDQLVISTKVGHAPGRANLRADTITSSIDGSLARLQTDYVDLYYAHADDLVTPVEETMRAFDDIARAGKVRYVGASNYGVPRLSDALAASEREGLVAFVALQAHYNLVERDYESKLGPLCKERGLACVPYFGLARGFLTGKYRVSQPTSESARPDAGLEYVNERGLAVLAVLDEIAADHEASLATVSLAWLGAQEGVSSPVASARTREQLDDLVAVGELELSEAELERLREVGRDLTRSAADKVWLSPN